MEQFLSHDLFSKWSTMTFHPGKKSKKILLDLKVPDWGGWHVCGFSPNLFCGQIIVYINIYTYVCKNGI